jgi:hypothetical protein
MGKSVSVPPGKATFIYNPRGYCGDSTVFTDVYVTREANASVVERRRMSDRREEPPDYEMDDGCMFIVRSEVSLSSARNLRILHTYMYLAHLGNVLL